MIITQYRATERGSSMAHLSDTATWRRVRRWDWWGHTLCGLQMNRLGHPAKDAPQVPATCRRCLAIAAKREAEAAGAENIARALAASNTALQAVREAP
jgi:hypothetical protein